MKIINLYLITINTFALIIMGYDKFQAIKNKTRISENCLLTIASLGGSTGIILGMLLFKHKIRKMKFILLIPTLIIIHTLIYFNIN